MLHVNKNHFEFGKKFSNLDISKHIHQNFINMGLLEEDNLFLQSEMLEEAESNANKNPAPATPPSSAKGSSPTKDNADSGGGNLFDGVDGADKAGTSKANNANAGGGNDLFGDNNAGNDDGANTGNDIFGGGDGNDQKEADLINGLPSDDQYYVVIVKDLNKKLAKLNEISLKLLNPSEEYEAKLIEKIRTLTYVFNRFIEKYSDYENPKVIIVRLQKIINAFILYIDEYIFSKNGE